jgi:hypothetical protein
MFQDEIEIQPMSDKDIELRIPDGEKNILFLMYSYLPITYSYNLFTDKGILKKGESSPHLSLPFLVQYKSAFSGSVVNLHIKNLDKIKASKFNLFVSFFD